MKEPMKPNEAPMPSMVAISNTTATIIANNNPTLENLKECVQILMELLSLNTAGWITIPSDPHNIAQPTKEKNMEAMKYILSLLSEGMSPEQIGEAMKVGDMAAKKCSDLIEEGYFDNMVKSTTNKEKLKPFMAARRVANA